jgi:hypothetical protein
VTVSYVKTDLHVEWMDRAIMAGGTQGLLVLWFLAHCRNLTKQNPFRLCYDQLERFGIRGRRTVRKYLPALEGVGLISVQWFDHAAPVVELLGNTNQPPVVPLHTAGIGQQGGI